MNNEATESINLMFQQMVAERDELRTEVKRLRELVDAGRCRWHEHSTRCDFMHGHHGLHSFEVKR
jgi:uncharacterized coiled-coil DUF342 family protein